MLGRNGTRQIHTMHRVRFLVTRQHLGHRSLLCHTLKFALNTESGTRGNPVIRLVGTYNYTSFIDHSERSMLNKILNTIGIIGILGGGALWVKDGRHVFSKDREEVVREVKDELLALFVGRPNSFLPSNLDSSVDATIADVPRCYAFVGGMSVSLIAFALWRKRSGNQ